MRPTSILSRRKRRRINGGFELQLTSMMDVLVIILVFMLKSYSTNAVNFAASGKIQFPTSLAEELPGDGAHVIIEPDSISFDGEKVLNFTTLPEPSVTGSGYTIDETQLADGKHRIVPLYDALVRARDRVELMMSKAVVRDEKGNLKKPTFHGTLIIQADKDVRYDILKKIMFTAGSAGYKTFKLVTLRKET